MLSEQVILWIKEVFNINYSFNLTNIIINNSVIDWYNDYSINEIDFNSCDVQQILGTYSLNNQLLPTKWNHNGMINPDSFQYLPCLITVLCCLSSLLLMTIRLVKRIYEIILLYCTMPIALSTLPLDDALSFRNWLENFISKLLILYGSILSINLFFFIFPTINQFNITSLDKYQGLFKLLLIIGSTIFIPTGQIIFDKIFKITKNNENSVIKEKEIIYSTITVNNDLVGRRYYEENNSKWRY